MSRPLPNPSASGTEDAGAAAARYAVVCRCGWTSRGDREETALEIECDGCGASQFVLPFDVYPRGDSEPNTTKRQRRKPADSGSKASVGTRSRGEIKRPAKLKPTPKPDPDPATTSTKIDVPKTNDRRVFTPLRLLIAAGIVVFGLTVFWTIHRNSVLAAEREFKSHADAGIAAVRERKFGIAAEELRLAVAALDRLDRDDAKAREVRQMLRESRAIDKLSSSSLIEMLEEFDAKARVGDDWKAGFDSRYANRWIVLVTTVRKDPLYDGRVVLDFPLFVGGVPVRLTGEPAVFRKLSFSDAPTRVIVAAQLQSCERVKDPAPEWQVRLGSDSAFLWTDYENFRAMGFAVAEDDDIESAKKIRGLLDLQAKIMGVAE